ncbi:hypothetical protein FF124_12920 [Martelella lutilitoris]|uniref:Uncharacterized protein n=1 Tax=Martelella lutilitoris TaxID=2583532 RepID=A0A5C4JQP3_9HYPH|nr:hypothetical protein [Martelella lutilitoris]TNB47736.1 hypothetical protein FF124_12920 [Martelella lutilitoris]
MNDGLRLRGRKAGLDTISGTLVPRKLPRQAHRAGFADIVKKGHSVAKHDVFHQRMATASLHVSTKSAGGEIFAEHERIVTALRAQTTPDLAERRELRNYERPKPCQPLYGESAGSQKARPF